MNAEKWNGYGRAIYEGQMVPPNGWQAWEDDGIIEAAQITQLVPGNPDTTLLEVGCGPGRLTRPLCLSFKRIIAVDQSEWMLRVVQRAAEATGAPITTFLWEDYDHPLPSADVALVWNVADADWTPVEFVLLLRQCAAAAPWVVFNIWKGQPHPWQVLPHSLAMKARLVVEQATHEWAVCSVRGVT